MNDVIAAIATAPGPGLRAIVRLSGGGSFSVANRLLAEGPDPDGLAGFSLRRVKLALPEKLPAKRELAARMLVMRGPKSYTTEDMVEFHFSGPSVLAELVLKGLIEAGARLAGPGEFTRRAYLGGRIDAAQVEGVLAIIESRSDEERDAAVHLLRGGASRETSRVRGELIHVLAHIEAYLDFTEEDTEGVCEEELRDRLGGCLARLAEIRNRVARRVKNRHLPRVVILGPPNAGKSSLFKALSPRCRPLISSVPGTTRDLLEGEVVACGRTFLLYDGPGITRSRDPLERLALSRMAGMLGVMDVAVVVFDGAAPLSRQALKSTFERVAARPHVIVLNKSDLFMHSDWKGFDSKAPLLRVSAKRGDGLDALIGGMLEKMPASPGPGGGPVDLQVDSLIQTARNAITEALEEDWEGGLELVAMELKEACQAIGMLAGPITDEEILDAVFSRFCIGK